MSNTTEIRRSDVAEGLLVLQGIPFNLDVTPWFREIYNSDRWSLDTPPVRRRVLAKTSRQVGKTVMVGNISTLMMLGHDNFNAGVIMPTDKQISIFSRQTIKPLLKNTEVISTYYVDKTTVDNVKHKILNNDSALIMGNAYLSAESLRGISLNFLCFDEVASLLQENVRIIEESMNFRPHKYILYTGTPVTEDDAMGQLWKGSTETEYMYKCPHCGYWQWLSEGNIGDKFLECGHCHKELILSECVGEWVDAYPDREIEGFHVSSLMTVGTIVTYDSILYKYREYPRGLFYNECLGLSYRVGYRPLSLADIIATCSNNRTFIRESDHDFEDRVREARRKYTLFAGVDWAMKGRDTAKSKGKVSYSFLTIGAYDEVSKKLKIIFAKRYYEGKLASDPELQLEDMVYLLELFGVTVVGADYGVGHKEVMRMKKILGADRIFESMYVGSGNTDYVYHPDQQYFSIVRTHAMDIIIDDIKSGNIDFPKYSGHMSEYSGDLTSIYQINDVVMRKTRYEHSDPDDFMHTLVYMKLAAMYFYDQLDYIVAGL